MLKNEIRAVDAGPLLSELSIRLFNRRSPRLLIDGLWLQNPFGGMYRVWSHILSTFSLPGITSDISPIAIIDRCGNLDYPSLKLLPACDVNLNDLSAIDQLANDNQSYISSWNADIFCSTWISHTGLTHPRCHEVALVHDCLPERFSSANSALLRLRKRWIEGASTYLSVSCNTALDLSSFYKVSSNNVQWCYPGLIPTDFPQSDILISDPNFQRVFSYLPASPFVLLPGSSFIGTYKNPELLAKALSHSSLSSLHLIITGINSSLIKDNIIKHFPNLSFRVHALGLSQRELYYAYGLALAVVIPSLVEGFGMPVIEVMSSKGFPIISDVPGLNESGAEAAYRVNPFNPSELIAILAALIDPESNKWLNKSFSHRFISRLSRLNCDLLGLCLLAQVRLACRN